METIGQRRAHCSGSINLVILKADILSALSLVGTATTTEELRQANWAYQKALSTARSMGYRPHIRAADNQQIRVDWVAIDEGTFCEAHARTSRQAPMTSKE